MASPCSYQSIAQPLFRSSIVAGGFFSCSQRFRSTAIPSRRCTSPSPPLSSPCPSRPSHSSPVISRARSSPPQPSARPHLRSLLVLAVLSRRCSTTVLHSHRVRDFSGRRFAAISRKIFLSTAGPLHLARELPTSSPGSTSKSADLSHRPHGRHRVQPIRSHRRAASTPISAELLQVHGCPHSRTSPHPRPSQQPHVQQPSSSSPQASKLTAASSAEYNVAAPPSITADSAIAISPPAKLAVAGCPSHPR